MYGKAREVYLCVQCTLDSQLKDSGFKPKAKPQWVCCGEGRQHQVPGGPHHQRPHLGGAHQPGGEKRTVTSISP